MRQQHSAVLLYLLPERMLLKLKMSKSGTIVPAPKSAGIQQLEDLSSRPVLWQASSRIRASTPP